MIQKLTYGLSINQALAKWLEDPKALLLGQDICDPFGGCFRITLGLSTKFPKKVINTPISEAGVTGLAVGLAMQGYKPLVEFMFQNFMTLAVDQILHNAVKVNKHIQPVDLTIRAVIGKPDYGFTHEGDEVARMLEPILPVIQITRENVSKYGEYLALSGPKILLEDSQLYTKAL